MQPNEIEYLNNYELRLEEELLSLAVEKRQGSANLFTNDDIHNIWLKINAEYMVDAIPNIAEYPKTAIAWAGYIGMAIAHLWDSDWSNVDDNIYKKLRDPRGFDAMDEYITEEIIGFPLGSKKANVLEDLMRAMADAAYDRIRHEQIEPQSVVAFHVFARTVKALYTIGASCELYRLGYKYHKL